ncbi:MucR family transcriptional regulator [Aminobacter sp. MDW-2]|nr:MucR family transcriptional regulator [Aminobacter sp. MDW-2]MRX32830.1 transcriptional regulator [Aminobacter sp. MDW-2]QNH36968.1 MucR family transcriptional regulator [Aminobacter sp. MDW-2]
METLLHLTSDIVRSVAASVPANAIPTLIKDVHTALSEIATPSSQTSAATELVPAVNPKKSVFDDFIICLEDGKKFKSLKRHLKTSYDMTPEEYRAKWSLARDYPMVAPAYAAQRSHLAKTMGLGKKPKRAAMQ